MEPYWYTCVPHWNSFFFPSVTERGRGNALRIHTRTQTTDSLLWGSSVLITTRSLLLETPGPGFSASHSTDPKAQAASSPCNKALSLAGWFVKSSFHLVKILHPFPGPPPWRRLGGEWIESTPEERDLGVSVDENETSQWAAR